MDFVFDGFVAGANSFSKSKRFFLQGIGESFRENFVDSRKGNQGDCFAFYRLQFQCFFAKKIAAKIVKKSNVQKAFPLNSSADISQKVIVFFSTCPIDIDV